MSDAIQLNAELSDYIARVSIRESEPMRRLREETLAMPNSSMMTSPVQTQFLALLARVGGARRCLEIGVFTGYTTLALASELPPDGRVIACDISEQYTSIARRYWTEAGMDDKIDLRIAPALDTLDGLIAEGNDGAFDFAYIDADKSRYADYYERVLRLLRPGGLVAADNVLWSGDILREDSKDADTLALRNYNETLRYDDRVTISLLPIRDGLLLACKR
jgi:predicted O-methyltransferase YrrM